jgi:predicted RNA-binding protein associated with RNAse of E/G family
MQTNPMSLFQQINDFKRTINGNPEEIVRQMVQSGQISQTQLNEAQKQASQIMRMMQK